MTYLFCSLNVLFRLRNKNKYGTSYSRQSNTSRDFNIVTEGLRSFLLEFRYGQKIINPLNRRG